MAEGNGSARPSPAQDRKSLLDVLTEQARVFITIDGEPYELRNAEEFTTLESHRLAARGRRFEYLQSRGESDLKPDQHQELERLPDLMVRQVLVAPDEVIEKLPPSQKVQIVEVFSVLQLQKRQATGALAMLGAAMGRSTGVN